ncbi:hypothetical protein LCGC14_1549020 [marine sediment metagenome]|uniref:PD-(D/E)XK endonuclease-like domain-containing protein n=1 Tax=marine sediment metagenome TaxID=412755 RepID=A0A0F9L6W6_9ZZZZ
MKTLLTSPNSLNLSSCMTKFMYDKIVEAAPKKKPAFLEKGDLMHIMLAEYYREKMKKPEERLPHLEMIDKAIELGRKKVIKMDLEIEESEDVVISTFNQYCLFWQTDPYTPVAIEHPVTFVLFEREDTDEEEGLRVLLQMIVDIIFENQQGHLLWTDHKTRSRNKEATPVSNQFMAYAHVSGTKRSMRNNVGFQKTVPPERKFTRDFFPYPQKVLEWWVGWTVYRAQFIDACIKSDNWPPDFTKCDEYSGCWFQDVCMQSPDERERFLNENFIKRVRLQSIYDKR